MLVRKKLHIEPEYETKVSYLLVMYCSRKWLISYPLIYKAEAGSHKLYLLCWYEIKFSVSEFVRMSYNVRILY